MRTTDTVLCTTDRVNSTTDSVTDILTDRMKVYNGLFCSPYSLQPTKWWVQLTEKMFIPQRRGDLLKRNSKCYQIKEGRFNEKDNEMVQLTKKFLKQTARHRWAGRFSARYFHVKSLQITFIDDTWQDAKWSLPVSTLLFTSIHKLYMSLLITFIKFFVIQISYYGI